MRKIYDDEIIEFGISINRYLESHNKKTDEQIRNDPGRPFPLIDEIIKTYEKEINPDKVNIYQDNQSDNNIEGDDPLHDDAVQSISLARARPKSKSKSRHA